MQHVLHFSGMLARVRRLPRGIRLPGRYNHGKAETEKAEETKNQKTSTKLGVEMNSATDLDSIASQIETIAGRIIANTHAPHVESGDSVTVTKDAWITAQVEMARLTQWVKGLAETHRQAATEKAEA